MRKRIEVTAADIAKGERGSPRFCPVARALRRSTGNDWRVMSRSAWVSGRRVVLSKAVERWVLRYDAGESVEPLRLYVPMLDA